MGKYMRKAKINGDVAVMEVSSSSLGVRTRAKTLALRRLQASTASRTTTRTPPPPRPSTNSESCYLQLRSRRLEKPPLLLKPKDGCKKISGVNTGSEPNSRASSRLRINSLDSGSVGSVSICCSNEEEWCLDADDIVVVGREGETEDNHDLCIEASFGENNSDFEGRGRNTRESTPCSFIRNTDTIGTPGSSTRPTSAATAAQRIRSSFQNDIPLSQEMEEFFACAEQQQQRIFMEKYNFDVVNDLPLPGRYEWVRVNPQAL